MAKRKERRGSYIQQYKYKIIVEDKPHEDFVRYIPMNALCVKNNKGMQSAKADLQWTLIPGCPAYCKDMVSAMNMIDQVNDRRVAREKRRREDNYYIQEIEYTPKNTENE